MKEEKKTGLGSYIGKTWMGSYVDKTQKIPKEPFDGRKLRAGLFNLLNPILWIKDVVSLFNIRKLIIYAVILGSVFGYAYWKGLGNKPIRLDVKYGKAVTMRLNGHYLHISKKGVVTVQDKNGDILKTIKVKDIPELNRRLKPYGFQLRPFIMGGASAGMGGEAGMEAGVGVSFFRFWKMELDAFVTTHPAAYLGTSYGITENTSVGVGVGRSLTSDDIRAILYAKIKF